MATYGLPRSSKILAELGKIALRHGHLDNAMKMAIKDLAAVSKVVALDGTYRKSSRFLRERVRTLAKQRFGDGPALVQLDALLTRAERATDQRNTLLHSVWGTESDFAARHKRIVMRDPRHSFQRAPALRKLRNCVDEFESVLDALLTALNDGFIFKALQKTVNQHP